MSSGQVHYLAFRPCVELLSRAGEVSSPARSLELFRLRSGEDFFIAVGATGAGRSSSASNYLLFLTSCGLVVYLVYKNVAGGRHFFAATGEEMGWASWFRWLFCGDSVESFRPAEGIEISPSSSRVGRNTTNNAAANHNNFVYVSPCPNCVRGSCKIRRHQQTNNRLYVKESTSTSGSSSPKQYNADDENSDGEIRENLARNRPRPEGKERARVASSLVRDESVDSIRGISGSMVDLVNGAREVRRLIREASFDSLASDFSLEIGANDNVGASTLSHMDSINNELASLKGKCEALNEKLDCSSSYGWSNTWLKSSKSDYHVMNRRERDWSPALTASTSKDVSPSNLPDEPFESSPDLRTLHKKIYTVQRQHKNIYQMTCTDLDMSPIHAVNPAVTSQNPLKRYMVRSATQSSNVSECGEFEWDSEGLNDPEFGVDSMPDRYHETWLPCEDELLELDLEAELGTSMSRTRRSSCLSIGSESDMDLSNLYQRVRLPPSGRSSVTKDDYLSCDEQSKAEYPRSLRASGTSGCCSRSSSSSSLKNLDNSSDSRKRSPEGCLAAEEASGRPMCSSFSAMSGLSSMAAPPLSPVHEVKEPNVENCDYKTSTPAIGHWQDLKRSGHAVRKRIDLANYQDLPDLDEIRLEIADGS